jgi:HEAT repeat protein
MTMTTDSEPAKDWQGNDLRCADCANHALSQTERCRLQHACVEDRYAKRIDRFFDLNPELAKDYLDHSYFEVRAVAAKHTDVFHLPGLMNDPDETVRWSVAMRLPQRYLLAMRTDPNREVRIRVAARLDESHLGSMLNDDDYYVRQVVARRLPAGMLILMMNDPDPQVRLTVARRLGEESLVRMSGDKDATVRLEVARRLNVAQLPPMLNDPDWRVRYEVVGRIATQYLERMLSDEDTAVRELASSRLAPGGSGQGSPLLNLV